MRLEDKKAVIAELTDMANTSVSVIAADYRGLTVSEMTELRKSARNSGVYMRVYRNTLARRAIKETPFACLTEALVGPIVLLFSREEPGAAARLVKDFTKKNDRLEVCALALGDGLLGPDRLSAVASLPSKDEALAQLMSVMQAPITKFVRTLREPYAQAVRVMGAVRDAKQAD